MRASRAAAVGRTGELDILERHARHDGRARVEAEMTIWRTALMAMIVLTAPTAASSADLTPRERADIDQQFNRASSVAEYLGIAGRYERGGLQQQAKAAVDHAARFCKTAADWSAVADAYRRLGYLDNAREAERRGRDIGR